MVFVKNNNEKIQPVDKLGICSLLGAVIVTGCVICDIGKSVSVKSVKLMAIQLNTNILS